MPDMTKMYFGEHNSVELSLGRIVHSPDWTWMRVDFQHNGTRFYTTLGHSKGAGSYNDNHQLLRVFTTKVIDALKSGDANENMKKFIVTPTFHDHSPMSIGVLPRGRV